MLIQIILLVVSILMVVMGLKGLTGDGIRLTRHTTLGGKSARWVGIVCILFGVCLIPMFHGAVALYIRFDENRDRGRASREKRLKEHEDTEHKTKQTNRVKVSRIDKPEEETDESTASTGADTSTTSNERDTTSTGTNTAIVRTHDPSVEWNVRVGSMPAPSRPFATAPIPVVDGETKVIMQVWLGRPDVQQAVVLHQGDMQQSRELGSVAVYPRWLTRHDLCSGKRLGRFDAPLGAKILDVDPTSRLAALVPASNHSAVQVWSLDDGKLVAQIARDDDREKSKAVPDSFKDFWAVLPDDERVIIYYRDRKELFSYKVPLAEEDGPEYFLPLPQEEGASHSPDGRYLVLPSETSIRLLDTQSGRWAGVLPVRGKTGGYGPSSRRFAFSPDGERLAALVPMDTSDVREFTLPFILTDCSLRLEGSSGATYWNAETQASSDLGHSAVAPGEVKNPVAHFREMGEKFRQKHIHEFFLEQTLPLAVLSQPFDELDDLGLGKSDLKVPGITEGPDGPDSLAGTDTLATGGPSGAAPHNPVYQTCVDMIAGDSAAVADSMKWFPAGKRPATFIRWGWGVYLAGSAQQPPVQSETDLVTLTGLVGKGVLDALSERLADGRFGTQPGEPGGVDGYRPVILGGGTRAELIDRAGLALVDVLVSVELSTQSLGISGRQDKSMRVRLVDVATRRQAWMSTSLSRNRLLEANPQDAMAEANKFINQVVQEVDDQCVLRAVPNLAPQHVRGRVSPWKTKPPEGLMVLPHLVELRYYQAKNLLTAGELETACDYLVGSGKGNALISGTADQRREALATWRKTF